ncbi:hypothetical protein [Aestuariivirga litoralis]|uniref:hypothetical protein n=1 Tax=Aestuariivirga litoralis TaxID=2650924 RepID=UPI0018C69ED7|nr:hypothetical protein [Aestuariivirga litoralis]MBG1233394.1 hypothetical protein [Aestuariivirga litoralis]
MPNQQHSSAGKKDEGVRRNDQGEFTKQQEQKHQGDGQQGGVHRDGGGQQGGHSGTDRQQGSDKR